MSIRIMTSVWADAQYTGGTLLVLLALADWANDEGLCWPKLKTLSEKARLSERAAQNAIKRLLLDEAISIHLKTTGPGEPHKYQIGAQFLHPCNKKGVQLETGMGAVRDKKGCSLRHDNKEEPSLEPLVDTPLLSCCEETKPPIEELFRYYLDSLEKNPKLYTLTPKRKEMGIARWREALVKGGGKIDKARAYMEIAIDQLADSNFHNARGKYAGGTKYNDWEIIFRSTEQFEKFLERSNG